MHYEHTQKGHLDLLLLATTVILSAAALTAGGDAVVFYSLLSAAAVSFLLSLAFGSLTVRDEGECLLVCYGPLPLFRKRIPYRDISGVHRSRSRVLDGWGIHWVPGRGWTFNLWGFDCVELNLGRRTLRIGSDDADKLAAFLTARTGRTEV